MGGLRLDLLAHLGNLSLQGLNRHIVLLLYSLHDEYLLSQVSLRLALFLFDSANLLLEIANLSFETSDFILKDLSLSGGVLNIARSLVSRRIFVQIGDGRLYNLKEYVFKSVLNAVKIFFFLDQTR